MTHDIEDLLNLIKELEERIIKLESIPREERTSRRAGIDDSYYWNHG